MHNFLLCMHVFKSWNPVLQTLGRCVFEVKRGSLLPSSRIKCDQHHCSIPNGALEKAHIPCGEVVVNTEEKSTEKDKHHHKSNTSVADCYSLSMKEVLLWCEDGHLSIQLQTFQFGGVVWEENKANLTTVKSVKSIECADCSSKSWMLLWRTYCSKWV